MDKKEPEDAREAKFADIQPEDKMTETPGTSMFNRGIVQTANPDRNSLFGGK